MKIISVLISILFLSGCNTKEKVDAILDDYISTVKIASETPRYGLTNVILRMQSIKADFAKRKFYFSCKDVQNDAVLQMNKIENDFLNFMSQRNETTDNLASAFSNLIKLRAEKSCINLNAIEERELIEKRKEEERWERERKVCDANLINRIKNLEDPKSSDFSENITDDMGCSYDLKRDLFSYRHSLKKIEEMDGEKLKKISENLADINEIQNDLGKIGEKNLRDLFLKRFKDVIKKINVKMESVDYFYYSCEAKGTIKNNTRYFLEEVGFNGDSVGIYRENEDREKIYGLAPNKSVTFRIDAKRIDMNDLSGDALRDARKEIESSKNMSKSKDVGKYCVYPKKAKITSFILKKKANSKAKITSQYETTRWGNHEGCKFSLKEEWENLSLYGNCVEFYSEEDISNDLLKEEDIASFIKKIKEKNKGDISITVELPMSPFEKRSSLYYGKKVSTFAPVIKLDGVPLKDLIFYVNRKKILEDIIQKHQEKTP